MRGVRNSSVISCTGFLSVSLISMFDSNSFQGQGIVFYCPASAWVFLRPACHQLIPLRWRRPRDPPLLFILWGPENNVFSASNDFLSPPTKFPDCYHMANNTCPNMLQSCQDFINQDQNRAKEVKTWRINSAHNTTQHGQPWGFTKPTISVASSMRKSRGKIDPD